MLSWSELNPQQSSHTPDGLKMPLLCRENLPDGHERAWPRLRDLWVRKDVFLGIELNNHSNNPWL